MMQTLVGRDGFARGMTLYFERHDGQAVTCDDFAQAIADANPGSELARGCRSSSAGTRRPARRASRARGRYDAPSRTYTLGLEQAAAPARGAAGKRAVRDPAGDRPASAATAGDAAAARGRAGQRRRAPSACWCSTKRRPSSPSSTSTSRPVPSLLRGFSAPVCLADGLGDAELLVLLRHDSDPFNRWEAGQRLALQPPARRGRERRRGRCSTTASSTAMRDVLRDPALDAGVQGAGAHAAERGLHRRAARTVVDPQRIHAAREAMRLQLAEALRADWAWAFEAHQVERRLLARRRSSAGRRALANLALTMLCLAAGAARRRGLARPRATSASRTPRNMTDRAGRAQRAARLAAPSSPSRRWSASTRCSATNRWCIDKWFSLQAGAPEHDGRVFERVKQLLRHPDFTSRNPNRARSLIGDASACGNPAAFHRADAAGYVFWADRVLELDADQPAARVARWRARSTAGRTLAEPYRSAARDGDRARRRAGRSCRTTRARSSSRALARDGLRPTTMTNGPKKNAFYAQSGGVTAVINASACGVIETARAHKDRIGKVYAGRNGIIGALTEDLIDTGKESAAAIAGAALARRRAPSARAATSSSRSETNRREYERLIEVFKAHDIGYFFYNGGGDSADTCFKVSQLSRGDGLPAAGDPRAEDGRQRPADHRLLPGLRLGRQVRRGVDARSVVRRALDGAHLDQGVRARGDGPARRLDRRGRRPGRGPRHPGRHPVPRDRVRREEVHRPRRRAGQGARLLHGRRLRRLRTTPTARFLAEQGTRDAFGHAQLGGAAPVVANMVKNALGHKFHWAVADYLQRAARHIASKTDVKQAYELGKRAVELALKGAQRGDADDRARLRRALPLQDRRGADLAEVANVEKFMPRDFISDGRLRHHREVPALPDAADPRRGLPDVPGRAAAST